MPLVMITSRPLLSMESSFNFELKRSGPLSDLLVNMGFTDFISVCEYLKSIPYGRNTNRKELASVIYENKGTCSTKHGFLKAIADEQKSCQIKLCIGLYEMSESNTAGVGSVLSEYGLSYIPEAHVYLRFNNIIYDFTKPSHSIEGFSQNLLLEEFIEPYQIVSYKEDLHKRYIKEWILEHAVPHDFKTIWNIREACIDALSQ